MSRIYPQCLGVLRGIELTDLSEFDWQVRSQYMPLVIKQYQQDLQQHESAQCYLSRKYGIETREISKFDIGFSNRNLGRQLPYHKTDEGMMLRGAFRRLKVYGNNGHEAFRGCIIVPIITDGELAGFYAERIDRPRRGARSYYWAPSLLPCVFNADHLDVEKTVYMFSNPFKAIQMYQHFDNAIATDPMFNLQEADVQFLCNSGVSSIVLVIDEELPSMLIRTVKRRLLKAGVACETWKTRLEVRGGNA